jgi:hypothetical protein
MEENAMWFVFRLFNRTRKEVTYNHHRNLPTRPEFQAKLRAESEARVFFEEVKSKQKAKEQAQNQKRDLPVERSRAGKATVERIDAAIAKAEAVLQKTPEVVQRVATKHPGRAQTIPTGQRPDNRSPSERDEHFLQE